MINQEASNIAGKNTVTYSSRSGKKSTPDDMTQFLRKFQLNRSLGLIGTVSHNLFENSKSFGVIKDVPISDSILAYIAMKLIEVSNDHRSQIMTIDNLVDACDMYFGLSDPLYEDDGVIQCLIRFGSHQFDFDREIRNSLSRTLAIYRDLWGKADSNGIDICKSIKEISGVNLEEALFLSYLFSFSSEQGYFQINLRSSDSSCVNEKVANTLDFSKQKAFIDWTSCKYEMFREISQSQSIPNPSYDKYRFNNLFKYPIIIPNRKLIQGDSQTYIVPIRRLLYERVSRGLYYDLTHFFSQAGKDNKFRESFGYVFQEYVGTLLRETIEYARILGEWKYAKPNKMTSDWIILGDEKAILVEVKQSGLYLQSKNWGDLDTIKNNLKKTIGAAVKQLWKFEKNIHEAKYDNLEIVSSCKVIERLIVIYDRSYFLNSILRDLIRELNTDIPEEYIWHVISIEELERILGLPEITLFKVLEDKRQDPDGIIMDFRDYVGRKYENKTVKNRYLDSIQYGFFNEFGVSIPELKASLQE
jgi:hypothetical protein